MRPDEGCRGEGEERTSTWYLHNSHSTVSTHNSYKQPAMEGWKVSRWDATRSHKLRWWPADWLRNVTSHKPKLCTPCSCHPSTIELTI